jgi:signal peptidase II
VPYHRKIFFSLVPLLIFLDQATKVLVMKFVQCTGRLCTPGYPRVREGSYATLSEAGEALSAGEPTRAFSIIDRFFSICHVKNPGAAFGLLGDPQHETYRLAFFTVVTLIAFVMILFYYRQLRADDRLLAISLAAVFAGAAGNFIDRLLFRSVTDFLLVYIPRDTSVGEWLIRTFHTNQWPAFNVADVCINVGVGLFIFHVIFIEPKRAKQEAAASGSATATAEKSD